MILLARIDDARADVVHSVFMSRGYAIMPTMMLLIRYDFATRDMLLLRCHRRRGADAITLR